MNARQQNDEEQARLWNGRAGQGWVASQGLLDRMFEPFERLLVAAAAVSPDSQVLDIGCGTGSTTQAIARRLGAQGLCVGIDISLPMIAAARHHAKQDASPAQFICADAQVHAFVPASFDTIISRFGVMFFDDAVQAFANLRHAARDDAALHFIAWRSAADNPFMTTAERAAAPLLPNLPARLPDAPGQFAFAEPQRVRAILADSGWQHITIRPLDVSCTLPITELTPFLSHLGPVGRLLPELDEPTRRKVIDTARAAFSPYVHGDEVRFNAACWLVSARAPSTSTPPREDTHD